MTETTLAYRKNVAIVVLNETGELLACHRIDRSGVWQLPQGGIDAGETDEEAMFRELEEEIGTRAVSILGKLPKTIIYDWPEDLVQERGWLGQEQRYFVVRLNPDAIIHFEHHNHKPEFDQIEWLTVNHFLSRLSGFKREPYTRALEEVEKHFPGLMRR